MGISVHFKQPATILSPGFIIFIFVDHRSWETPSTFTSVFCFNCCVCVPTFPLLWVHWDIKKWPLSPKMVVGAGETMLRPNVWAKRESRDTNRTIEQKGELNDVHVHDFLKTHFCIMQEKGEVETEAKCFGPAKVSGWLFWQGKAFGRVQDSAKRWSLA